MTFVAVNLFTSCCTGTQIDSPTAQIIDGKAIADSIRKEIADEVKALQEKYGKVCAPAFSRGDTTLPTQLNQIGSSTSAQTKKSNHG